MLLIPRTIRVSESERPDLSYVEWSIELTLALLAVIGYLGFVAVMTIESLSVPIPSEIVIPLGGYLAYRGEYNLLIVILACTVGCVLGSLLTYWACRYGGRPFIDRYGKWFFLTPKNLERAEGWFKRYGAKAICLTRMCPMIRTLISFPAGLTKYDPKRFVLLTALGSFIWCSILALTGYALGAQWQAIIATFDYLDIVIVAGLVALFAWWAYKRYRGSREGAGAADR